ncbi:MAG: ATP-binding protein [Candidatus Scalindua sp.]|nr:ATP-binding protein [Candidatus Scalindua sp.]
MKNMISHNLKEKKRNKISELSTIFDSFNSNAQKLEASYKQLQDRIREIDREMAQTNECLNKKVQELNNLTMYLNSILESMYCGVVAIDIQGRIETFNRSAEKILHVKAGDVIGKNVRFALTQINGFNDLLIESLTARKKVINLKRLIELKDGNSRYIESSISILHDKDGCTTGLVEIFQDLSEIRELKGRLYSVNDLVSVGTMAACIAHEIRNPLNGIEGFASLLEREVEGDNLKLVNNIILGTKNINKIVTDLLLLARPIELNLRKCELSNILDRSLVLVSQELRKKGGKNIQLKKDYVSRKTTIICDPERLQQAFLNIILNAIQSMHEGGELTVFTRELVIGGTSGIQIGFSDTGEGISNHDMKNIFDPFFTTKTNGTGLGLVVVRKIIELHGGEVSIRSKEKKGATILLKLPCNPNRAPRAFSDAHLINYTDI